MLPLLLSFYFEGNLETNIWIKKQKAHGKSKKITLEPSVSKSSNNHFQKNFFSRWFKTRATTGITLLVVQSYTPKFPSKKKHPTTKIFNQK